MFKLKIDTGNACHDTRTLSAIALLLRGVAAAIEAGQTKGVFKDADGFVCRWTSLAHPLWFLGFR
jgi:hypothetical protein